MSKPDKVLAAVLAAVFIVGGLYWLALGMAWEHERELREEVAEQARAEKASSEKMALKSRAYKLGYDRGQEEYRPDAELPSEAVLKESARPIIEKFEIQPDQLDELLHQYALGYGWGWNEAKTASMSVSPVESP